MKVTVINCPQDAKKVVSLSARTCYNSRHKDAPETRDAFIRGIIKSGHESVLEHVSITFDIEGVSRALLAQLTRHRLASFSVQSQRYVKYNCTWKPGTDYIIPDSINDNKEARELYLNHMSNTEAIYNSFIKAGIKPEDARMVLPEAFCTNIVLTVNIRELRHILKLRLDKHAQWEIRELAQRLLLLAKNKLGSVFFEDLDNGEDK